MAARVQKVVEGDLWRGRDRDRRGAFRYSLLEPGVNRHFEPGEFDQFQPKKNSQQSSAIVNYSKRWSIFVPSEYYNVGFPVRRVILSSPCPR